LSRLFWALVASAYAGLSAVCLWHRDLLLVPLSALPDAIGIVALGPPALLTWGVGAVPIFVVFTALLFIATILAVRRSGARRIVPALAALAIWMLCGVWSAAISI
jgi:hypothetical protein